MTVSGERVFRASAPARLDFAGGWTDVAPFAEEEHGLVINAAIDLRARAELVPGGNRYVLRSHEMGETLEVEDLRALESDGKLGLLTAALRLSGLGPCALRTRSDAPPGSGLGSSGALDVALVAVIDASRGITRSPLELAEEAFRLESVEASLPGGRQDQYAAALGGFNRLAFARNAVRAEPLLLDSAFLAELASRIVVCYTGTSRVSSRTISRVMTGFSAGTPHIVGALRSLVDTAEAMAHALTAGDLARVGELLNENWLQQQRLDPEMTTDAMKRLEDAMRRAGSLGGKAAGAGAGGSMFFVAGGPRSEAVAAARAAGARVLDFTWAMDGATIGPGA
jgi:D-glycero-alpha-D-manno-heptose-7-phosphate kinase